MDAEREVKGSSEETPDVSLDIEDMTRDEVVETFRGLVTDTAGKISERLDLNLAFEDLRNWGFRGLLEAYERFDSTDRSNSFSSFAFYRVRGAIYDGLRKSGWGTRGTACELRDSLAINEYLESNYRANQDVPTAKTFADSVNYLDEMVGNCVMICLVSQAELSLLQYTEPASQQDHTANQQLAAALEEAVTGLEDIERDVIKRYILEDESLSSIGDDLGYSKSWVSRVNARALEKMRTILFGTPTQEGLLDDAEPEDFLRD